jgi:hypothetical protein
MRAAACPTRKDLGKSVLIGKKGAVYDAFLSAKHESSTKIVLKCERVIEQVLMGMRGTVRH